MNPSLFTVDPHTLDNYDLKQLLSLQQWQHQVSKLFDQILRAVPLMPSPPNSAVYMDGTGNWSTPPTGTGGGGDMFKATYDINNNGVADTCDSLAYSKLTGAPTIPTVGTLTTQYSITGGGSMQVNQTINLTGDVPTPSNGQFYGMSGGARGWFTPPNTTYTGSQSVLLTGTNFTLSGDLATPSNNYFYGTSGTGVRGWYQIPYSSLSGLPTIPTVGILTTSNSITGGGSMTGNLTVQLVGDTASPGNSQYYGTNASGTRGFYSLPVVTTYTASQSVLLTGSNFTLVGDTATPSNNFFYGTNASGTRGWYQIPYSSLSGLPSIPTVGTLTTQQSLTGGGSMTGNLTINLVGDVTSPGNNYFYGTSGAGTRGWYALPTTAPPPTSLTDLGSPAGNSTINTASASVIAVNLNWTTAANWTLTLQNVALGAQLYLRLLNSSGVARSFTITATNPSAASYTVTVLVPGSNPLSGAISINNGNALNVQGIAYTVGGTPTIQLFGFGSTG